MPHEIRKYSATAIAAFLFASVAALPAYAQDAKDPNYLPSGDEFVTALNGMVGGAKPGFRASHAKGICAKANFVATPEAKQLSKAVVFSGSRIPATVRFSVGGGNPKVSDKARNARGMAIVYDLGNGEELKQGFISSPMFFAKTPAQALGFMKSRALDPATGKTNPDVIKAFADANPETKRQGEYFAKAPIPASFTTVGYWGVNTFIFVNDKGVRQPARWVIVPQDGIKGLTEEQIKNGPDVFLADELRTRLASGAARFDFYLQLPEAGDDLLDPSLPWPETRKRVKVGVLSLTSADAPTMMGSCVDEVHVPLALPDGIEPSDDAILLARAASYAVSNQYRTGTKNQQ
jgi:catalase